MKIVIDISEEDINAIKIMGLQRTQEEIQKRADSAIQHGTPLPKGHGDLKDAEDIITRINLNYNNHQSIDAYSLKDMIVTTQTVIPADRSDE